MVDDQPALARTDAGAPRDAPAALAARREQGLAILALLAQQISAARDVDEVIRVSLESVMEFDHSGMGAFVRVDPDRGEITHIVEMGLSRDFVTHHVLPELMLRFEESPQSARHPYFRACSHTLPGRNRHAHGRVGLRAGGRDARGGPPMIDHFAALLPEGDPVRDVVRFYQVAGRLDTLAHVTRVAEEARSLATRYGADVDAADLAALAHDLAAVVPVTERLAVAAQMGVQASEADRAIPALLHGSIAAAALAAKLGVGDEDLLNAIRYHSTLRAGASRLEKIVFLADKIAYDPTSLHRGEYLPALQAAGSLDAAALVYLDFLLDNTWRYGWYLHPHAVAAYRDLAGQAAR